MFCIVMESLIEGICGRVPAIGTIGNFDQDHGRGEVIIIKIIKNFTINIYICILNCKLLIF